MSKNRIWSQDEIKELHRLKNLGLPLCEIAVRIGRSCKSLEHKLYGKPIPRVTPRNRDLTEKEIVWIINHFKHTRNEEIMRKFGISHSMLHRIARENGLSKTRQFMRKTQDAAQQAAAESHKKNGTYPPKGYIIPNASKNRFQPGQSNRDRLSPKKYAECQKKRQASWRETYDKDRRRTLVWGFEQRTKFRFVKQSKSKISVRYNLRKKGYIECPEDHNLYFYPTEEMRHPKIEENAIRHGIKFKPAI
ncbi:hypothetical protein E4T81_12540 [Barnesiella sp. WM24]|uniref:hypothetical protein n=1 Tax=Barnesiella sp. WM24 TaxID=2558278 RepID=UPI001071A12E|nr:hypothetical protein [Barnesiella sp. WM24]TFU92411.1 hypothetical protein E4T81_12540 [Barnesiella sp. WM24]